MLEPPSPGRVRFDLEAVDGLAQPSEGPDAAAFQPAGGAGVSSGKHMHASSMLQLQLKIRVWHKLQDSCFSLHACIWIPASCEGSELQGGQLCNNLPCTRSCTCRRVR